MDIVENNMVHIVLAVLTLNELTSIVTNNVTRTVPVGNGQLVIRGDSVRRTVPITTAFVNLFPSVYEIPLARFSTPNGTR